MEIADIPAKFPIPWGASAVAPYIRAIPEASQTGIQAGAASLTDGFPPLTFQPEGSGGVPPWGADTNGILNQITLWSQWQNAGGTVLYDSTFQTDIGGYPQGSIVQSATTPGNFWLSMTDNNVTNPDLAGAGWVAFSNASYYALDTGAANAYVAAPSPALPAYALGIPIRVKIANTNAAGASTLNINGLGAKTILARDGTAPRAGDLVAGSTLTFLYNGTALICDELAGQRVSFGIQDNCTTSGGGVTFDSSGNAHFVYAGASGFLSSLTGQQGVFGVQGSDPAYSIAINSSNNASNTANNTPTVLYVGRDGSTSRSINAGGTVNASGADYADYETKADGCGTFLKGQIVGYDADGLLTDKWSKAVAFGVKSSDPSYVGGDKWGDPETLGLEWSHKPVNKLAAPVAPVRQDIEGDDSWKIRSEAHNDLVTEYAAAVADYEKRLAAYETNRAALEAAIAAARPLVDRIAKAGKVPCIVSGTVAVGEYVIAAEGPNDTIIAQSVKAPTAAQRTDLVGRIRTANPSPDQINRLIASSVPRVPGWNAIIEVIHA